jgi:demethylmenaquinone methyltransferase/2-methoxy-6-polyprenyl-1,4-benzoquinol methylase
MTMGERGQITQEAEREGEGLVHFGYRLVKAGEKKNLVRTHFATVAEKYDFMNTVLSFGAHFLWKKRAVDALSLKEGARLLDLCGGTGDMSLLAAKRLRNAGKVVLYDINPFMLEKGKEKLRRKNLDSSVRFVLGDAELLSLKTASFDACIVAFGVRNLTHMTEGFREMLRVLKPGGEMVCLEFSIPRTRWFRWLYDVYSFRMMPLLGEILAGSRKAYTYLPESIRVFPSPEELARLLRDIGFEKVRFRLLTDGIAVIHKARKPS